MSQLFINITCLCWAISYKFHSIITIVIEYHKNSVANDFGSFKIVTIVQQN